LYKLLETYGT